MNLLCRVYKSLLCKVYFIVGLLLGNKMDLWINVLKILPNIWLVLPLF